MKQKKVKKYSIFIIFIIITVGFCTIANAQLVPNLGNGQSIHTGQAKEAASRRKPLYTPSRFDDKAPGFPSRLLLRPFTQQQYDYTRRVHFGFVVSASALDYKIISSASPQNKYFADVTSLTPAMGVAALLDYRINHSFSMRLQAGPTFGTRSVSFYDANNSNGLQEDMEVESVLVELAFLLKYKALRHNDVRPYMIGGVVPYCDVSAFKGFNAPRDLFIAVNPFDVALAGGIGVDAYAAFFKFSLELKYVMGLTNTLSSKLPTATGSRKYTNDEQVREFPLAIEKMYSHAFVLSIIFE
ncbi:MAG: PorT family protein [Prevotellaceae bacterium]|jgi:hypothetical protein|nr:PorT family protein [Prevotellaceae bacterium]